MRPQLTVVAQPTYDIGRTAAELLATARGATGGRPREVVLVPVLRAGLGMLDSILQLLPHARVGFIGGGGVKFSL